jgi:hypothetical protein
MPEPLSVRRELLQEHVLPRLTAPIQHWPDLNASLSDVIDAVRTQGLEGVIAKNLNSIYEPGLRSGAWRKIRLNRAGFRHRRIYFMERLCFPGVQNLYLSIREVADVARDDCQAVVQCCCRQQCVDGR